MFTSSLASGLLVGGVSHQQPEPYWWLLSSDRHQEPRTSAPEAIDEETLSKGLKETKGKERVAINYLQDTGKGAKGALAQSTELATHVPLHPLVLSEVPRSPVLSLVSHSLCSELPGSHHGPSIFLSHLLPLATF